MLRLVNQVERSWKGVLGGDNPYWWAIAPIVMAFADLSATLRYQPLAYWSGDYSRAVEGNPLALIGFQIHPLVVPACVIIWCLGVAFLAIRMPRSAAIDLILFLVIGHSLCICGWVRRYEIQWFYSCILVLLLATGLVWPIWNARSQMNSLGQQS